MLVRHGLEFERARAAEASIHARRLCLGEPYSHTTGGGESPTDAPRPSRRTNPHTPSPAGKPLAESGALRNLGDRLLVEGHLGGDALIGEAFDVTDPVHRELGVDRVALKLGIGP